MSEPWAEPECYWCRQSTSGRCIRHAFGDISRAVDGTDYGQRGGEYYLPQSVLDALRNIRVVFDAKSSADGV